MKKLLTIITILATSLFGLGTQVFATNNLAQFGKETQTTILKECGAREDGIMCVLELVIDIMTIGIGILGVIGISVTGIQYLTAGGSEEKTRKAKRRMLEIIIGLAAYAVGYGLLKWLGV
ncbi:hypothetical protein IKF03_01605 [Candidatus Saccharibacteria bacterium]|nr:hypothetical protein [Candidatus Saccharibacteria bacterium]